MLIFQARYCREDARRNPEILYVFGDNTRRIGMGGQAGALRGEKNAVGVATKYFPGDAEEDYFGDEPAQIEAQKRILDTDMKPLFAQLVAGGVVIWPSDGIGTGLSRMPDFAPTTFEYLESKLAAMQAISDLFRQKRVNSAKAMASAHV
jgi:hypothetical protein